MRHGRLVERHGVEAVAVCGHAGGRPGPARAAPLRDEVHVALQADGALVLRAVGRPGDAAVVAAAGVEVVRPVLGEVRARAVGVGSFNGRGEGAGDGDAGLGSEVLGGWCRVSAYAADGGGEEQERE